MTFGHHCCMIFGRFSPATWATFVNLYDPSCMSLCSCLCCMPALPFMFSGCVLVHICTCVCVCICVCLCPSVCICLRPLPYLRLRQLSFQAERSERTAIMQEEEQHKELQRQNFNNMVETARAEAAQNPPPAHDPMRFRAVPPGNPISFVRPNCLCWFLLCHMVMLILVEMVTSAKAACNSALQQGPCPLEGFGVLAVSLWTGSNDPPVSNYYPLL